MRNWLAICGVGVLGLLVALGGCPFVPNDNGNANDNTNGNANENGANANDNSANENTNGGSEKPRHERIFTDILPEGFQAMADCLICHEADAEDLLASGHWQWEGSSVNIVGHEDEVHGKLDLLNNFCITVPSNEGRCAQCHPSYGWTSGSDESFFADINNVDCFICHDTTGTYRKHPTAGGGGGQPALLVDGELVLASAADLQDVVYNVGTPSRQNCGLCHFFADGGDGVKHGDLSTVLNNPTRDVDVHMGGLGFSCQECHSEQDHGIAGFALHHVDEGGPPPACTRCHGAQNIHAGVPGSGELIDTYHLARVACETCHIPAFARSQPTQVEWYWSEAGQDIDPIPVDEFGQPTYDKMKGRFVWDENVQPTYLWFNGKWERRIVGVDDTFDEAGTPEDPVVLAAPVASIDDPDAKIYPFKKMIGDQPADAVAHRLLVPHLFGTGPGLEHPYWVDYDWDLALAEGTAYAGQPYSGAYEFVATVMYLKVSHEIPPPQQALQCADCHENDAFFEALGYEGDPLGD